MTKPWLILAVAVPLAALAAPPGPSASNPSVETKVQSERMEKRMRITRALGLAEALDLNEAQALKMQEGMAKFDDRRKTLVLAVHESMQTLNRAASGDQAAQGQVDQAAARIFDARAQIQQLDREMYQAVTQGLPPQKRARAAVFLGHFSGRFGMGPGGMGSGMAGDRGMMRGFGRHGQGMGGGGGVGRMGSGPMGAGPMGDCPYWAGDDRPADCPMAQQ